MKKDARRKQQNLKNATDIEQVQSEKKPFTLH